MRSIAKYGATVLVALSALIVQGCETRETTPTPPRDAGAAAHPTAPASAPAAKRPAPPWTAAAIAHGGAGTPPKESDGCRKAVDEALAALARGDDPLDAAAAGVVVMEDDARFNAGTGSRVRIDGKTVQMDASLMDSNGKFGAVAVIEDVKNPIRVARAVINTPHLLMAGDGATRFARTLGMDPYDPATDEMREATKRLQEKLIARDPSLPRRWQNFDWRQSWNFERTIADAGLSEGELGSDTVGVAVRTTDGRFAVALSTGGTAITLRGRVGDVPIYGAGMFAGSYGAVAATGSGERIIEKSVGRTVHQALAEGATPKEAAEHAVRGIAGKGSIGLIVLGPESFAAAAATPMAWAARRQGDDKYAGPTP
jgi:isoaspartyl peptidase/L-asparaginase-like protein (Ntn-hydrolase superfamily)